ncbi:MAG: flotillin family protein, partial [Deltaproteobacteria bacterium]
HGGGALVVPMVQGWALLPLDPMVLSVNLKGALSKTNIRVNVPSNFTIAISTQEGVLQNAAERLLGLSDQQRADLGQELILGQLRLVVASLTIEEINQDREKFLNLIAENVDTELHKVGLEVINVNITDITDESGYIQAIGRKAAAEAIAQAEVDVAEQERMGAIGVETARRDRAVAVSERQAESLSGQKQAERTQRIQMAAADAEAVGGENTAEARMAESAADLEVMRKEAERTQRIRVAAADAEARVGENLSLQNIAESAAKLEVRRAEASRLGRLAEASADRDVARLRKEAEVAQLEATVLAKQEVERRKVEIDAPPGAPSEPRLPRRSPPCAAPPPAWRVRWPPAAPPLPPCAA